MDGKERIATAHCGGICAKFGLKPYTGVTDLLYTTARNEVLIDSRLPGGGATIVLKKRQGERIPVDESSSGQWRVPMPPVSILEISPRRFCDPSIRRTTSFMTCPYVLPERNLTWEKCNKKKLCTASEPPLPGWTKEKAQCCPQKICSI